MDNQDKTTSMALESIMAMGGRDVDAVVVGGIGAGTGS